MTTIRRARVADAPPLSRFAAACFRETYAAMNTAQDMDRYVAEKFSAERQSTEIADPAGAVILAESSNARGETELAGYAQLVRGALPACVAGPAIELSRFYVASTYHGRGLAATLFDAVVAEARALGVPTIWLGVWERNPRAIAFYRKQGFVEVGAHDFVLGSDVQHDLVFTRPVAPGCSTRLLAALAAAEPRLRAISDAASATPRAPGKWSPREIIGHLIDSASNNHQRFVRGARQDDLVFPGYEQDAWVALQRYADTPWRELLDFWLSFNRHIARVMAAVPEEARLRVRTRHNLDELATHAPTRADQATLDYFMHDYVDHLELHLGQILDGRP